METVNVKAAKVGKLELSSRCSAQHLHLIFLTTGAEDAEAGKMPPEEPFFFYEKLGLR